MVLFILACLFVISILYLISTIKKPYNFPPGPSRLPVVGNTFLIKKLSKQLGGQYKALLKLSEEFNTDLLGLKLGKDQYVVVFGRKLIQQVYTKDEFMGRPDGFFIRLRTMGERRGITMTDGPLWQEQRNFAERQLRQLGYGKLLMENVMKEELQTMLSMLGEEQEDISLNHRVSAATLNVLWIMTGGKKFCKDEDKLSELLELLKQRSKAFDMAGGLLNQIPWMRFICPEYSGYNVIQSLNKKLHDLFLEIIIEHKKTLSDETRDFVDAFLKEKESSTSGTFTDDQLIAVCLDFFIAGALTSSYTLDFAILAVVSHPHVQQKLQRSFDEVLQRKTIPSLKDRSKLPYVEAVLLESQRFQHVVPTAGPRRVLRDTTLGGYNIPKNTIMLLSLRSIHYDTKRWPDPEVFRPERFLDDKGEVMIDEGLCTFGLGKRRCPENKIPSSDIPLSGILLAPQPYKVSMRARGEDDN